MVGNHRETIDLQLCLVTRGSNQSTQDAPPYIKTTLSPFPG